MGLTYLEEVPALNNMVRGLIVLAIGAVIWFIPVPDGVKLEAWRLLAIFVATIAGFILQPLPIGAIAIIAVSVTILLGVLKPGEALSGFSNATIWLIVSAFLFSRGFIKTGFGRRIAYMLIRKFGDRTLKLGYILAACEFIFGPFTPSNTARGGGIIYPIVRSLATAFQSEPDHSPRRIGAYLMFTEYQMNCISSALFMTAMTGNPLIAQFASKTLNIEISWGLWTLAAIIPALLSMLVIPYYLYKVYPPVVTHTPEARTLAEAELKAIGPLTRGEKVLAAIFVCALLLWSTSSYTKIDATAVALLAVSVMMITKVISWNDVLEEKGAWDTFVWMGSLVGLATFLEKLGLISWFAKSVSAGLVGISAAPAFLLILGLYMYSHYGFASMVGHIVALYSALVAVMVLAGVPPYLAALSMAYASSLCGSLTHYAAGPAPIYFGSGYIKQHTWWKLGFYISIINLVIWIGIGPIWWKVLGLW